MEIISQCGPLFCTLPKMAFLSSSVWAGREYMCKLNWKKNLLICFRNFQDVPCSYRHSRNRMNTFIIVNITPYVRGSLEDKSILVHFKKVFPLTSRGHSFERRAWCLLLCSENYQGIPYFYTGIIDSGWWTRNINPTCKR